jgi:hypothetical protein
LHPHQDRVAVTITVEEAEAEVAAEVAVLSI